MKRSILFICCLFSVAVSFGQRIRFSDSTNIWNGYDWSDAVSPSYSSPYRFSFAGDTIIHGVHYRALSEALSGNAYVREDTVAKKVFVISTQPPENDTTEQLLYDYSLNTGDTFRTNHVYYVVTAKDSVTMRSSTYHTWHLHPFFVDTIEVGYGYRVDIAVLEGVGCMNDPLFPLRPFTFESISDLTCFSNRGTSPAVSDTVGPYFNNTTSCSLTFGLGTDHIATTATVIKVVPNPADRTAEIILPFTIATGNVAIWNGMGQEVFKATFKNKASLLIGDKINVPGIYFYRVVDDAAGQVFQGKFVD